MRSQIPEKIASLNFPDIERVVLAGSGVLELHGIRRARDIDLATSRKNIDHLFEADPENWIRRVRTFTRNTDGTTFERTAVEDVKGEYDVWQTWYHPGRPQGDRIVQLSELIENSTQHDLGFYALNLEYLMEMKAASDLEKNRMDVLRYQQWREYGY